MPDNLIRVKQLNQGELSGFLNSASLTLSADNICQTSYLPTGCWRQGYPFGATTTTANTSVVNPVSNVVGPTANPGMMYIPSSGNYNVFYRVTAITNTGEINYAFAKRQETTQTKKVIYSGVNYVRDIGSVTGLTNANLSMGWYEFYLRSRLFSGTLAVNAISTNTNNMHPPMFYSEVNNNLQPLNSGTDFYALLTNNYYLPMPIHSISNYNDWSYIETGALYYSGISSGYFVLSAIHRLS
jgi:hypothetical protein